MNISAQINVPFEAILSPYGTGRAAMLTIEIFDPTDGTILSAPSSLGIVETMPETYWALRAISLVGPGRILRWRDGEDVIGEDIVDVAAAAATPSLGEPTYATVADLELYLGRDCDDDEATRVLLLAERDVDLILGLWDLDPVTGLKWTPVTELAPYEAAALRDATCAQVEYRLEHGETFFVLDRPERVTGPDFQVEGRESYIGPKVWVELARAPRLRKSTGLGRAII